MEEREKPLSSFRSEFEVCESWAYLDHAALAPISRRARRAGEAYLEAIFRDGDAYYSDWFDEVEVIRARCARLIGAQSEEVAFVANTTVGINEIASGLSFDRGQNVVVGEHEFPSNLLPWWRLEERGVEVRTVREVEGRIPPEHVLSLVDENTRIVALSFVEYSTGYRQDLSRLGRALKDLPALFFVDAIQGLGAFPLDVEESQIDFLVADGHKWLLAPDGIAIFYGRRERLGDVRPSAVGWLNSQAGMDFDHPTRELRTDARRFEAGSRNMVGLCALGASVALLQDVGLGRIGNRILELTDRLVLGLEAQGHEVLSPRFGEERSGIVMFLPKKGKPEELREHLLAARVVTAVRRGRVRVSPHFYNSDDEIDRVLEVAQAFT